MFKFQKKEDNVRNFIWAADTLFLLKDNSIDAYSFIGDKYLWKITTGNPFVYGNIINDLLICFDGRKNVLFIKLNTGDKVNIPDFPLSWNSIVDEKYLLERSIEWVRLFDVENHIYIWKKDYSFADIYTTSHSIFASLRNNNIIVNIDLLSGSLIWQQDLSVYCEYIDYDREYQKGKIENIIGLYNEILWLATSNYTILGLDKKNGEIRHLIKDLPNTKRDVSFSNAFLDADKGIIHNLTTTTYCSIDCLQGNIVDYDITEETKQNQATPSSAKTAYDGENIYFQDSYSNNEVKVGAFNVIDKKIVWKYVFSDKNIRTLLEVKYANNRLYVKDSNRTLHILEKN